MPNFEHSNSTQKTISSYSGDAMDRVMAIWDNNSGPSGVIINSQKVKVTLKDNFNYEHILITEPSGTYKLTAGCALSSLFYPFQTKLGNTANTMPGFWSFANSNPRSQVPTSGVISLQDVLPYQWDVFQSSYMLDRYVALSGDYNSDVVSSDVSYRNTDRFRDSSDIRSVGLRLPLMGVGWGFTTAGVPFPTGGVNASGTTLFKGNYNNGWMVDPADYVAAPIDLRYDTFRNVWTSAPDQGVLRPCLVKQDGGTTSGNGSSRANLTYSVYKPFSIGTNLNSFYLIKDSNGNVASGMTPLCPKFNGAIVAASSGMYFYSGNNLILFWVDEVPDSAIRSCA